VTVVVVSKTRMREGRVCVGAHDVDRNFLSLRLYRHDGTYLHEDDNIEIGQTWDLRYRAKAGIEPPHVEDVIVEREGAALIGAEQDLEQVIRARDVVWQTLEELFEGCLRYSARGSAFVPAGGPLPSRSTGYWHPSSDLVRQEFDGSVRYRWTGAGPLRSIRYVGLTESIDTIRAGRLVRLSLSRRFAPAEGFDGYWLQLSGWYGG
jgi:hypothetical protein